jgi:hypothetical protein
MDKSIYDLELHETIYLDGKSIYVTRVPGGWLYKFIEETNISIFVPFNNEFMAKQLPEPTPIPSSGTPITLV